MADSEWQVLSCQAGNTKAIPKPISQAIDVSLLRAIPNSLG